MLRRVIEENSQKICHMECWVKTELGMHLSVNISLQNNFKNLQNHSSGDNFFFFIEWSNKSFLSKNIVFHEATKVSWIKMLFWMISRSNSDGLSVWVLIFFFFCKKKVRYVRLPLCFLSKIIWFPIFYVKKLAKSLDFVF